MFEQLIQREKSILETLQIFLNKKLNFIVVGGYAVSAFKHRFSVDADIVISSEDLPKFETILKENNFKKTISKKLQNIYSSRFIRYEKKNKFKIAIDLLIDALASRQTNASWSFDLLNKNSIKKKIIGSEKEITVKIPVKELLMAFKIHSGRLTDFRDIVALAKEYNINTLKKFLIIGNKNIIKKNLLKLLSLINKKEFIDSFKGVFIEKKYDIDEKEIKKLKNLIKYLN